MKPRRGFALLASVWLMAAIAAVGLEVSWLARTRRLATANAADGERAHAAATAGLEHARARLTRALDVARGDAMGDPWRFASGGDSAHVGDAHYTFEVRDDASVLDLNLASEAMLARLFEACGAASPAAAARARAIVVQRLVAPADEVVPAILPADGRSCAQANLQVGGSGAVNPNTASVPVLRALPGVGEAAAVAIVSARRGGARLHSFNDVLSAIPAALRGDMMRYSETLQRLFVYQTMAVRVASRVRLEGSPVTAVAVAQMRRAGGSVFVEWQEFR